MQIKRFPNTIIFQKVDELVRILGGYWPPLSALARLTEEIGELTTELQRNKFLNHLTEPIANEIADVYFITITLAHNYCVEVPDDAVEVEKEVESFQIQDIIFNIYVIAGEIARNINGYEGPKAFRTNSTITPLYLLIPSLLIELRVLDVIIDSHIDDVLLANISEIRQKDTGRFPVCYEPNASEVIEKVKKQFATMNGIKFNKLMWGGLLYHHHLSFSENMAINLSFLKRFIKITAFEKLEMLVLDIGPNCKPDYIFETLFSLLIQNSAEHYQFSNGPSSCIKEVKTNFNLYTVNILFGQSQNDSNFMVWHCANNLNNSI